MDDARLLTEGAHRVADALDGIARALADAWPDSLVAVERDLSAALASWVVTPSSPLTREGAARLRHELVRLRVNLDRCRRLGAAFEAVAQGCTRVQTQARGYDSRGSVPQAACGLASWEASA